MKISTLPVVILCLALVLSFSSPPLLTSATPLSSSISPLPPPTLSSEKSSGSYHLDDDEKRKIPDFDKSNSSSSNKTTTAKTVIINIDENRKDELNNQSMSRGNTTSNGASTIIDSDASWSKSFHSKVLLLCSVNSIRFWSPTCSIHGSSSLWSLSRPSLLNYGISSVAVWHRPEVADQLFWYDVHGNQLHQANLYQAHHSDCASLVAIDSNRTLPLDSNPHFRSKDKMVKLAIDSAHQVLFVSHFIQSQIDLYRINENLKDSKTEVQWIGSVEAEKPNDVLVDHNLELAFWIEGWMRICRLDYSDVSNLTKVCSENLGTWNEEENRTERIYAMALDRHEHELVWAEADGRIYRGSYLFPSAKSLVYVFQPKYSSDRIVSLELLEPDRLIASSVDGTRLYEIDLGAQTQKLVLAESSAIFDMHLVEMPRPLPSSVTMTRPPLPSTMVAQPSTSTTKPTSSSTSPIVSDEPSNPSAFVSNSTERSTEGSVDNDSEITLWFYLIMFFALLVSFLLVMHHIRRDREPFYSHLPSASLSNSFHRILAVPCSVLQSRTRTQSTDRQELCRSEGEDPEIPPEPVGVVSNATPTRYQQNLLRHSHTPARDIEDILSRPVPSMSPNCLTCRDTDICIDKGICMATYRVH